MSLEKYSTQDLEFELAKREKERKVKSFEPVANPDLTRLIEVCKSDIKEMLDGEEDTDTEHYIYEEAMQAIFGRDVFDRIRNAKNK